jgi:signal peptidase I
MRIPEILLGLLIITYCITLPSLLKRAERDHSALGYIPIVNFFPFLKMIKRPWWWFFLILIPGVNLIMLAIINVELGISFGKRSTKDQWLFGALPWFAIAKLTFKDKEAGFVGARDWTNVKKSFAREWGEAIIFAVVAASVIRSFFLEAFTIPTPSMERSMLVGDYLFVSKMSYGAKLPQTPVSVPFVHNTLPGSMTNSYVDWFSLPYFRLPGFGSVERFDPVVFNFPHGDTILVHPYYAGHDYYGILRNEAQALAALELKSKMTSSLDSIDYYALDYYYANESRFLNEARSNFMDKNVCLSCSENGKLVRGGVKIDGLRARPVDKKENYIKRCIGLPGDNLEIKDRQVFINGQAIENPQGLQYNYFVKIEPTYTTEQVRQSILKICAQFELNLPNQNELSGHTVILPMTSEIATEVAKLSYVDSMEQSLSPLTENNSGTYFPSSNLAPYKTWSVDNFGPVHIPAKNETITLTLENLPLYKRVIDVYEDNTLEVKGGKIFINGVETTSYTFKYNYYWMMGDNRHNSADSRVWGFVPENHVVGKAVFTWFSKEDPNYRGSSAIRWNRMFKFVD